MERLLPSTWILISAAWDGEKLALVSILFTAELSLKAAFSFLLFSVQLFDLLDTLSFSGKNC